MDQLPDFFQVFLMGTVISLVIGALVSKLYLLRTHYPMGVMHSSQAQVIIASFAILGGTMAMIIWG